MNIKTTVEVGESVYMVEAPTFELHEEKLGSLQRFVEYKPGEELVPEEDYEPDPSSLYREQVEFDLTNF
jgi:hypothetical protein